MSPAAVKILLGLDLLGGAGVDQYRLVWLDGSHEREQVEAPPRAHTRGYVGNEEDGREIGPNLVSPPAETIASARSGGLVRASPMNSYPGRGPRFFFAVILMAAATAGLPARAAPEWQMLETPRFTIISQQKEKTTREFAEEFNQFVEALHGVITVDERALPPLTIVLFAREKDFRPFQPLRPDGKY